MDTIISVLDLPPQNACPHEPRLMQDRSHRCSRRKFLAQAAALTLAGSRTAGSTAAETVPPGGFRTRPGKPSIEGRAPLAVVCTVYRPLSHAYHLAGRFLHGYCRDGQLHLPRHFVRSVYVDQRPENDLSRELAQECGFRVAHSVAEALTLDGSQLAVEGVLLIGEHGNYPRNDRGQILYPRYALMEQIVTVFRQTGQSVPVFNDKHLSYSWEQAQQMVGWSTELHFPLMAGSSLPVTWRRPELELPLGSQVEDLLLTGFGPIEVHGFDALEALQVMAERRRGGETGVRAVTCLTGKDVWKAGDAGLWSWDLLEAALARSETVNPGDVRHNVGTITVPGMPPVPPTAFLIEYRDGSRGTVLLLNGHIQDFCVAARIKGETQPASCLFHLPAPPGARHFDCLASTIEKMLESGKPSYPVERTLLTTGILEVAMTAHHFRGTRLETPHLEVHYSAPVDSGFWRLGTATLV
jgi:hypothetical protein